MLSPQQVDEIIEKNDIGDVISEYVKLERKGNGYSGLCPFHNEKTPSFSIHEGKQIFKCFGCGKAGNVVNFIMYAENLNYYGALEFLAERVGISIEKKATKAQLDKEKLKNDIISVNRIAARFYYDNLKKSTQAQRYLYDRGIKFETVKKFGLGYAPDSWDALYRHFSESGISPDNKLLENAGLITAQKDKNRYYDKFRNRIMFPIMDASGNVIAFGGRVMDDSLPKYLNSPETVAYIKGKNLYALNVAKKSQSKTVILVEGYMDCIAINKAGIDWVVASLGTALTIDQAKLLKKYFDKIVIGYDSDSAGQKATQRAVEILEQVGFRIKILTLGVVDKNVKDPDEFLKKHSKEEFLEVVEKSKSVIEYKIEKLAERYSPDNVESKPFFLDEAVRFLSKIKDDSKKVVYYKWFTDKYDVTLDWLLSRIEIINKGGAIYNEPKNKKKIKKGQLEEETPDNLSPNEIKLDKYEKTLLLLISDDKRIMSKYYPEAKKMISVKNNVFLLDKLKNRFDAGGKIGPEAVLADSNELPERESRVLTDIISKWLRPPDLDVECKNIIRNGMMLKCDIRIAELKRMIADLDIKSDDYKVTFQGLMEQILTINKERKKYENGM